MKGGAVKFESVDHAGVYICVSPGDSERVILDESDGKREIFTLADPLYKSESGSYVSFCRNYRSGEPSYLNLWNEGDAEYGEACCHTEKELERQVKQNHF